MFSDTQALLTLATRFLQSCTAGRLVSASLVDLHDESSDVVFKSRTSVLVGAPRNGFGLLFCSARPVSLDDIDDGISTEEGETRIASLGESIRRSGENVTMIESDSFLVERVVIVHQANDRSRGTKRPGPIRRDDVRRFVTCRHILHG